MVIFDPVAEPFSLRTLDEKFRGGAPSPHLRAFADAIGLSVYKEGAGVIAVRTLGFLTEPKQVLGRAIDAGVGIAIPASDFVVWRGEIPVEATVEVLK